jgi:hypothetical protein
MKFTEEKLLLFAAPLSDTEDQRCKNAISMVCDALKQLDFTDDNKPISKMLNETLAYTLEMRNITTGRRVKIFIQGSYANNTCVRMESDVDIAIIQEDTFQPKYRSGIADSNYGFTAIQKTIRPFKDEIQLILIAKFGKDVERGDKSIKIHGNSYRKDTDAVPCRRLRDYRNDYRFDKSNYIGGVVIYPDSGGMIVNYPEQHIENGYRKDINTSYSYKRMVRIIKKMRHLMEDKGYLSAKKVSSFGLESLLWNIEDMVFTEIHTVLWYTFDKVVECLKNNFASYDNCLEANGIKRLFPDEKTKMEYQQFIRDLSIFYEYEI